MRFLCLLIPLVSFSCGPMMNTPDAGPTGCRDTSKTPANLLENPGFECDSTPAEWRAVYGTLELVAGGRSGRAAKITMDNALGARFTYSKPIAIDAGMKNFCVRASISGTVPFMKTQVIQTGGTALMIDQSDQPFPDFRKTPLGNPLVVPNGNATKLELVFMAQTGRSDGQNAMVGQYLLIDDVDVWETSGNCTETR